MRPKNNDRDGRLNKYMKLVNFVEIPHWTARVAQCGYAAAVPTATEWLFCQNNKSMYHEKKQEFNLIIYILLIVIEVYTETQTHLLKTKYVQLKNIQVQKTKKHL